MLDWSWPYAFALLPLPLLVYQLVPAASPASPGLRMPLFSQIRQLQGSTGQQRANSWLKPALALLVWLLLVTAVARPTWLGDPVPLPQAGRDLLLAVDISQSMREEDMLIQGSYVPRVDAVKAVVSDFVQRRQGDRVGLILFGEQSYLQTPLTFDRNTVEKQLMEAQPGFAGNATAIGDAIGLAVKRLRDRPAESRVVILMTDGANTAGKDPMDGAAVAQEAGIRIHTIGIGADSKTVRSFFGTTSQVNPSADLDEATLQAIAEETGGRYFRARDPQEMVQIYQLLNQLEPVPEDVSFRPQRSLYHWPLLGALLLSLVWLLAAAMPGRERASD